MKLFISLLIFSAFASSLLHGDQSVEPNEYYFIQGSPKNKFYAVQTVWDWKIDQLPAGYLKQTQKSRLQVFETATGKLRWESTRFFFHRSSFYLSDDGDHFTHISPSLPDYPDSSYSTIKFYNRDKIVGEIVYGDLKLSHDVLYRTTSRARMYDREIYPWFWELPAENVSKGSGNPSFEGDKMYLKLLDGKYRVFDYKKGELLEITEKIK